jgi:hypothetical protein
MNLRRPRSGAYLQLASALCACLLLACNGCAQHASEPATAEPAATPAPASEPAAEPPAPADVPECNGAPCAPPKQCIRYAGIAGPKVPLYACGVPCGVDDACPPPTTCRVIADGPRLCE